MRRVLLRTSCLLVFAAFGSGLAVAHTKTSFYGRFNPEVGYPGGCAETYELNIDGSGCDVSYRVVRPSYRVGEVNCTDLLVVQRSNSCTNMRLEILGQIVRKCAQDMPPTQLGQPTSMITALNAGAANLAWARSLCQENLDGIGTRFETFDRAYDRYQHQLQSFGSDLVQANLQRLMRMLLDETELPRQVQQLFRNVFDELLGSLSCNIGDSEGPKLKDWAYILSGESEGWAKDRIERELSVLLRDAGLDKRLASVLADALVHEAFEQGRNAIRSGTPQNPQTMLISFADGASDALIGLVAALGDQYGLSEVMQTELQLLKAEVSVLLASTPFFAQNTKTRQICADYVALFNQSAAYQIPLVAGCAAEAAYAYPELASVFSHP